MAVPAHPSSLLLVGIAVLVAWRMYSRVRRLIGRQRLSKIRPWIAVGVFSVLVAMLAILVIARPVPLASLGAGVVVGIALATWGLRLTKFEVTPEGLFYTPNLHIGIALSSLLAGRILYRMGQMYLVDPSSAGSQTDFMASAITLAIFGTLAGYYVRYAVGLILWRRASQR